MVMVGGVVGLAPLMVVVASPISTVGVVVDVDAEFHVTDSGGFVAPAGLGWAVDGDWLATPRAGRASRRKVRLLSSEAEVSHIAETT